MDINEEIRRRRQQEDLDQAIKEAAGSGATYGGLIGGTGALFGGVRSLPKIALAALTGAGASGAFGAGSTYVGSKTLGAPEDDDEGAFTTRGTVGGGLFGGAAGAGLGALLASGKLKWLLKSPKIAEAWKKAESLPPINSLIGDWAKKLAASPHGTRKVAALTGAAGAGLGAYQGLSEGMGVDAYRNALKNKYLEMVDDERF